MSQTKNIENFNGEEKEKPKLWYFYSSEVDSLEHQFRDDPLEFLLNNLLMSVQFFENYERDVKILRENWYKDVSLKSYHIKCFHADQLIKLAGKNVKFVQRDEEYNESETSLHPLRIYVSSDNIDAAYDPSALKLDKKKLKSKYWFTVKASEENEKSGCVQLIQYRGAENGGEISSDEDGFEDFIAPYSEKTQQNSFCLRRKSNNVEKNTRRLTAIEKFIGFQKKSFLNTNHPLDNSEVAISANGFYKFTKPESGLKPTSIHEFRMNCGSLSPLEIPQQCFQRQEVKQMQPRMAYPRNSLSVPGLNQLFKIQTVLNSAAFKGYFCDVLIERLSKTLSLDLSAVNDSSVLEEYIMVNQLDVRYDITPVIPIKDWNKFVMINKKLKNYKSDKELQWPSIQMQRILNVLPCNAVPSSHVLLCENSDCEKEWKLIFPKSEQFLFLHMMHVHVRCYLFLIIIYKSFMEPKINPASFGPKHLLHLLFWRVHKNFIAWPEDRPSKNLIECLEILYKKLQNKCLNDFFIPSRNLFVSSYPKDLHRVQTVVKKILENPVHYIIKALKNIQLKSDFYPMPNLSRLGKILSEVNLPNKPKKIKKDIKTVRFEDDEQQWKKTALEHIEMERKANEEQTRKLSEESVKEILSLDPENSKKSNKILKIFVSHFIEMGTRSMEFESTSQALLYLNQAQKLFQLMVANSADAKILKILKEKLNKLEGIAFDLQNGGKKSIKTLDPKLIKKSTKVPQKSPTEVLTKTQNTITKQESQKDKIPVVNNLDEKEETYETKL